MGDNIEDDDICDFLMRGIWHLVLLSMQILGFYKPKPQNVMRIIHLGI